MTRSWPKYGGGEILIIRLSPSKSYLLTNYYSFYFKVNLICINKDFAKFLLFSPSLENQSGLRMPNKVVRTPVAHRNNGSCRSEHNYILSTLDTALPSLIAHEILWIKVPKNYEFRFSAPSIYCHKLQLKDSGAVLGFCFISQVLYNSATALPP